MAKTKEVRTTGITLPPWQRRADMVVGNLRSIEGETRGDVVCRLGSDSVPYLNADANGKLIAAAPDLRASHQTLLEYLKEAHQPEIDAKHNGDDTDKHPCTYCQAIAAAERIIKRL